MFVFLSNGDIAGNVYELHTPDGGSYYEYTYNVLTVTNDRLSFSIKACNDAHIMLQTVPGSIVDRHFEIVIGGWSNTRSAIRDSRGVCFQLIIVLFYVFPFMIISAIKAEIFALYHYVDVGRRFLSDTILGL
jgi:hypothetical protein